MQEVVRSAVSIEQPVLRGQRAIAMISPTTPVPQPTRPSLTKCQ
jgi:hypothetical protein